MQNKTLAYLTIYTQSKEFFEAEFGVVLEFCLLDEVVLKEDQEVVTCT